MKRNRHGRAKIITQQEIQMLFSMGLPNLFDRCLFALALFSSARINEVCTLFTEDIYNAKGQVRSHLTIRKSHTKGQLGTRTIPIIPDLKTFLVAYYPEAGNPYLFPGRYDQHSHINSDSAARILRKACAKVGIDGIPTSLNRPSIPITLTISLIPSSLPVIGENAEKKMKNLEIPEMYNTLAIRKRNVFLLH